MNITFKYKDGRPDYVIQTERIPLFEEGTVLIDVARPSGRKRAEALTDIFFNLEYLFRDLKNMYNTDIEEMTISDCILGDFVKKGNDVFCEPGEVSIYDSIIFNFCSDTFLEKLLFTRNNAPEKKRGVTLEFEGNTINESMIGMGSGIVKDATFLKVVLSTIKSCLPQYNMKFDAASKKFIYTYKGSVLRDIEDIKEDDVFLFFKFIEVMITKPDHYGIFFIDMSLFRTHVLRALLALIDLNYMSSRLIFLYNCDSEQKKLVVKNLTSFVLPNHKIPLEDGKKAKKK
jgi:hypothetical protein